MTENGSWWIPTSVALPDDDEPRLIFLDQDQRIAVGLVYMADEFSVLWQTIPTGFVDGNLVSHWMDLPNTPSA